MDLVVLGSSEGEPTALGWTFMPLARFREAVHV
jgi:hypothetical protein